MAWLDFLKNGNELSELLIEGNNPYGSNLLKQADVDQMRDHIITQHPFVGLDVVKPMWTRCVTTSSPTNGCWVMCWAAWCCPAVACGC